MRASSNLRELRRIAADRTLAEWVWMTPVPVDEERAANNPAFQYGASSWRNSDITALADGIREFDEPVVDLVGAFERSANPDLQGPDGVHPSLVGQQRIVTTLVKALTAAHDVDGRQIEAKITSAHAESSSETAPVGQPWE